MNKIYGVYFICCINNYLNVVEEQLKSAANLLEKTKKLIIFVTIYNNNHMLDKILQKYNKNDNFLVIHTS